MKKKNISAEVKSYKKNLQCQNCPYFINKLVCPFRRKKAVKDPQPRHSGYTQDRENERDSPLDRVP